MSVSVVITTLNRWPFLDECLASVAAQTDKNWEAIVVNDDSDEPDTLGVRAKWNDSRFRWIDRPERSGPSTARNAGIAAARHPLVFVLDNDDTLHPQCLERLQPILDDPEIDCAYSDFEFFGSVAHVHRFEDLDISQLARTQFLPAQVLMRKSLWERVRGYSADRCFVPGNEDWDFWLSCAEAGFRYYHLRETLYRYRVHAGGLSKTSLTREDYRTREAMYRRHSGFIDRYSNRKEFLGPGYWHSASAYCRKGTLMKSLALGLRAFLLIPDFPLARDLIRRNLTQALGQPCLTDMIGRIVNRILLRFDRRLQCDSTFRLAEQKRLALEELLALAGASSDEPVTLQGIVFSKDRPTQLHALLVSYFRHAADPVPLHVIYKATTEAHEQAYREVFACFDSALLRPVVQGHFQTDVVSLLESLPCSRIVFFVDDIIFLEPFAFADFLRFDPLKFIPTLRLGRGLTECYTRTQPQLEPPYLPGIVDDPRLVVWQWKQGEHDYGFPLSVDGQIYSRREIAIIARHSQFGAPNTFENALQIYHREFAERYAVAYEKACLVNVPLNRVQQEWESRHGGLQADALLEAWHKGLRWNVAALDGYRNRSTHEEVEVELVPR